MKEAVITNYEVLERKKLGHHSDRHRSFNVNW